MEEVPTITLMGTINLGNGSMIRKMDVESIFTTPQEKNKMVNGKMANAMAEVSINSPMEIAMMANGRTVLSQAVVC